MAVGNLPWAALFKWNQMILLLQSYPNHSERNKKKGGNMRVPKLIFLITVAVALVTLNSTNGFCADVAKIGTVNFEKIFNSSAGGKAVKNKINEEGRGMNADLEKIQNEIKELQDLLKKDDSAGVMDETAKENKRWELERKIEEVKALKKRFDRKIQELQVRLINGVRKDVLGIISEYGQKEGYLMIIEDINAVYTPKTLDITDKIIQLYDVQYSKKSK
jgi:outer membrane protein